jgi:Endonuclease-reverse transcriptase
MHDVVGGGTAFLLRDSVVIVRSPPCPVFKSFEPSSATLKLPHSKLTVYSVYRPPPACHNKNPQICAILFFSVKWTSMLTLAATNPHEFLIIGDFNLHLYRPDDCQVKQFLSALDSANLTQHVSFPTRRDHHILDLVITATSLHRIIDQSSFSPSDHFPFFLLS